MTLADAMYAPVVMRFKTYGIELTPACMKYCEQIIANPFIKEWIEAAQAEPDDIEELEVEY